MAAAGPPGSSQLVAFARQVHPRIDQSSYYDLLQVPPGANVGAIRAAFYRAAAQLHPDRYHSLPDAALRAQLETVYARICEGYRVLLNPEKRALYDKGLAEGKFRWDSKVRESKGPKNPEDSLTHAQSKKFFRLGMIGLGNRDWKGAVMNFNFARTFEPQAPVILEKLAEAQAGLNKVGAPK